MSKSHYKIPNSLDRSLLDQEISLSKGGAVRPIPLKVILFYLCSLLGLFWVISSTFVKNANAGLIFLFVVWWVAATVYFSVYSKTKELRAMGVPALLNYMPKASRKVMTRSTSNASEFYGIAGVRRVDHDGRIEFLDGTVGQSYLVVGSASILVFEADMRAMLDRVDSFYRKIDTSAEFIWLTMKEPQQVLTQLANMERRNLDLEVRDPELFALMDEQASILTDYVGKRFSSIHQYLIIKADNDEALRRNQSLLYAEVQDSGLMVKTCAALDGPAFTTMMRKIYASAD
jgi:hypothetical protein